MRKLIIGLALVAGLVVAGTAGAGGWATVQLSEAPSDGVQAGAAWNTDITVLQHGETPLSGLQPTVTIRNVSSGESKTFAAKPTGRDGVYTVSVTFPSAGKWTYEVYDGFGVYGGAQTHTFAPVEIVGGGAAASGDGSWSPAWTLGGSAVLLLALIGLFFLPRLRRPRPGVAV
jgi:hypothetical protein